MGWKFNQDPSAYPSRSAYQSAYHKAKRAARIAAGQCGKSYTCTRHQVPGRTMCAFHLKKHKAATKKSHAKHAPAPLLVDLLNDYDAVL